MTDETLRRFAAGVAHDFGNFLTVIRGFGELLASQHRDAPELIDGLNEIVDASKRAAEMAQELVVIGQRQNLAAKPVDLNEAVGQLLPALPGWLGESVTVKTAIAPCALQVLVDEAGLRGMLLALCAYAKAGMLKGGTMTLMTDRVEADVTFRQTHAWADRPAYARLRVKDTAGPLAPEHLAHLFEPFYSQRILRRGTGLATATVLGWMTLHSGSADVEADQDGLVFSLYFPLAPAPASASANAGNG